MTRGEQIAEDVRQYLFTNGLKQSQLTGALLAEIADRCLKRLEQIEAKKKRLATEEDWIKSQEEDAYIVSSGVNVRMELAACQFWCKNNGCQCTRARFNKWLAKAAREALLNGGGERREQRNPNAGPAGWLTLLNRLFPECVYAKGGTLEITHESDYEWNRLDRNIRSAITEAA